jgi:Lipid A 3-O-deacylase (PagL)
VGYRISALFFAPLRCNRDPEGKVCFSSFAVLSAALCFIAPHPVLCQNADPVPDPASASETFHPAAMLPSGKATLARPPQTNVQRPVASDITVEGMVSYGNYKIFASGENCRLYDIAIEYDRHSWGRFLGARMDYVAEVIPLLLLTQPTQMDIWGNTLSQSRKTVPGIGIAPIGFRWLWLERRPIKPYLTAKGGIIAFTQKPLSSHSTYENFSLQSAGGVQVRINSRYDLRLGLFGDFHFSDGFIVPVNPGLDVMNATMGLTYHLGNRRRALVH